MFVLEVSGMGCGGCVSKITHAIHALDATAKVLVDRPGGEVRVESVESAERIRVRVNDLGFAAQVRS